MFEEKWERYELIANLGYGTIALMQLSIGLILSIELESFPVLVIFSILALMQFGISYYMVNARPGIEQSAKKSHRQVVAVFESIERAEASLRAAQAEGTDACSDYLWGGLHELTARAGVNGKKSVASRVSGLISGLVAPQPGNPFGQEDLARIGLVLSELRLITEAEWRAGVNLLIAAQSG